MTKEKIEEVIVVEGKDDTKRLKEVFDVDTIETRGSAIDESILEQIEHAQETRGVIVFTDPDFSGENHYGSYSGCPACFLIPANGCSAKTWCKSWGRTCQ